MYKDECLCTCIHHIFAPPSPSPLPQSPRRSSSGRRRGWSLSGSGHSCPLPSRAWPGTPSPSTALETRRRCYSRLSLRWRVRAMCACASLLHVIIVHTCTCVAGLGRNLTLILLRILIASLRSKRNISELPGWGSYWMCSCDDSYCIYTVRLNPALNGSSEIRHFKRSDIVEIRNGIMFAVYPGLPHVHVHIL